MHVLIIDDNAQMASMIQMSLSDVGLTSHYATSITEAREFFHNAYRVIIADMRLGGNQSGLNIAQEYMRCHETKSKVIIYSAYTIDEEDRKQADIVWVKGTNNLPQLIGTVQGICMVTEPGEISTILLRLDKVEEKVEKQEKIVACLEERTRMLPVLIEKVMNFIENKGVQGDQLLSKFSMWKIVTAIIVTILTILGGITGILAFYINTLKGVVGQ